MNRFQRSCRLLQRVKLQRRRIVMPSQAGSIKDQDLDETLWTDWYKQNKWKEHLGTQEMTELDSQFLQQDFLDGDEIKYSSSQDENFEDFTQDIMNLMKPNKAKTLPMNVGGDEDDETYHDTFKLFQKQTTTDSILMDEMRHITELRDQLKHEDARGKEYEVILPSGDVVDYDIFKESMSAKSDRLKTDPYKMDHKNQLIDVKGRTIARGGALTARVTVLLEENLKNEGMTFVNGEHYTSYYGIPTWRLNAVLPLLTTGTFRKYNVFAFARGGGKGGQSKAMRLALARALAFRDPSLRLHLQPYRFLERDPKMRSRSYPMFKGKRKRTPYKRR